VLPKVDFDEVFGKALKPRIAELDHVGSGRQFGNTTDLRHRRQLRDFRTDLVRQPNGIADFERRLVE
jgi:hypothetical protein